MFKRTITAITAASIALASVPVHAGSSVYDWEAAIQQHNELIAADKYSAFRLGKHTNSIFSQVQGPDGYVFGNIVNDEMPLPRVRDIKKVIAASKEAGKVVIVASNDWILPSNPVFCEVAEQVMMECGDFTATFMRATSDLSDEEFNDAMVEQTEMLEMIARTMDLTLNDGPSLLEKMLIDAGKDISSYAEAIAEVASLLVDEINLEALEYALNNWDETVELYRQGMIEGHLESYAAIITVVQDNVDFLESEVARLEVELAAAKAEIVQLKGRVASLESSLAATQAALASTQAALATANDTISTLENAPADIVEVEVAGPTEVINASATQIQEARNAGYTSGKNFVANQFAVLYNENNGDATDLEGNNLKNVGLIKTKLAELFGSDTQTNVTIEVPGDSFNKTSGTYTVRAGANTEVTVNTTSGITIVGTASQGIDLPTTLNSISNNITYDHDSALDGHTTVAGFASALNTLFSGMENEIAQLANSKQALQNKITAANNVSSTGSSSADGFVSWGSGVMNYVDTEGNTYATATSTANTDVSAKILQIMAAYPAQTIFSGTEISAILYELEDAFEDGYEAGYSNGYADGYTDGANAVKAKLD